MGSQNSLRTLLTVTMRHIFSANPIHPEELLTTASPGLVCPEGHVWGLITLTIITIPTGPAKLQIRLS